MNGFLWFRAQHYSSQFRVEKKQERDIDPIHVSQRSELNMTSRLGKRVFTEELILEYISAGAIM